MKTIKSTLIILLIPLLSFTQVNVEKQMGGAIQRNNKNEISFYKSINSEETYSDPVNFFNNILKASKNDEFKLYKKGNQKDGILFEEYHQYFKGIPVKSGVFILHRKNGLIQSANGNYVRVGELNAKPTITIEQAMENWCNYLMFQPEQP